MYSVSLSVIKNHCILKISERAKQSKMGKNNLLGESVLLLLSLLLDPFSRQAASPMKYYDTSFRWDSIMSYKIVYLCYVAQGDKPEEWGGPSEIMFLFAGGSLFAQKIFASVFPPMVLRVFSMITCNLKCVKHIFKKNNLKMNINVDILLCSCYSENLAASQNHFSLSWVGVYTSRAQPLHSPSYCHLV